MILDLQRKLMEIGRIRIGEQVATASGKTRPSKLDTFRLTSADRIRIEQAAQLYGGTVQPWDSPAGRQWQVITTTDSLNVIVPPSAMSFSQAYETWSAGGCQRRCDGVTETIGERPCVCDPDNRECNIHTRLSVMLSDLPGLGVYRLDTSGYYAAVELQGAVEVIQLAAGRGTLLPARLRLEQRTVKRVDADGKSQTRRFAVPVLDVEITPAQLIDGAFEITSAAPLALTNGGEGVERPPVDITRHFEPVPEDLPVGPQRSIAEQSAPPPPRPKRRNAAPPIPPSGRQRRHAGAEQDASVQPSAAGRTDPDGPPAKTQNGKLHAMFSNDLKIDEREDRLALTCEVLGKEITSWSDLKFRDAQRLIDEIQSWVDPEGRVRELLNTRTLREVGNEETAPAGES